METKRITRSSNKVLGGVCAGFAEYYNADPSLIRVGVALLTLVTAVVPALIIYCVAWLVMPEANRSF